MEFERENPTCKFTIPDSPTVRQQLEYFSQSGGGIGKDFLIRYWMGARSIIQSWECEIFPDMNASIDKVSDSKITDAIVWAGIEVKKHIQNLDSISKNS